MCIYAIERTSRYHQETRAALAAEPFSQFGVSHLVMAECLVKPLRCGDSFSVGRFEDFFKEITNLELTEPVFRQAAQIRAANNLKMPDALHLACAQFHNCDALWTNDDRLGVVSRGLAQRVVG
jgi:uncharacterized protein